MNHEQVTLNPLGFVMLAMFAFCVTAIIPGVVVAVLVEIYKALGGGKEKA